MGTHTLKLTKLEPAHVCDYNLEHMRFVTKSNAQFNVLVYSFTFLAYYRFYRIPDYHLLPDRLNPPIYMHIETDDNAFYLFGIDFTSCRLTANLVKLAHSRHVQLELESIDLVNLSVDVTRTDYNQKTSYLSSNLISINLHKYVYR